MSFRDGIRRFRKARRIARNAYATISEEHQDMVIGSNVLGFKGSPKTLHKSQMSILGSLKYLVFYPAVKIVHSLFKKRINELKKDEDHLYLINRFNKAFNQAGREWTDVFVWGLDSDKKNNPSRYIKTFMADLSYKTLFMAKELVILMARFDSAYLEFMNILLINIYKEVGDQYKGEPSHILYQNKRSINDPAYFLINTNGGRANLKERVRRTEEYVSKEGKINIKNRGGAKFILEVISAELGTTPDKLELSVQSLLRDNQAMFNALNNIHNNSRVSNEPKN